MNSSRRSWYGIFIAVLSFLMVGGALLTALAQTEFSLEKPDDSQPTATDLKLIASNTPAPAEPTTDIEAETQPAENSPTATEAQEEASPTTPKSTNTPFTFTPAFTQTDSSSSTCGPPTGWIQYTVQSGDTLFSISQTYQTTVYNLQVANCMVGSTKIITGKQLWVPNNPTITPAITNTPTATKTASPVCYSLAISHTGTGSDPTLSLANSTGCPVGKYLAGETITLTAKPASGWQVSSWTGTTNNTSTATTNTVKMPAKDHSASVSYSAVCFTLSLSVNAASTGTGGVPTPDIPNSTGCAPGEYVAGESITLTASPDSGNQVDSWTGTTNNPSTSTTNTVKMPASNHSASVVYVPIPPVCFTLTLSVDVTSTGTGSEPTPNIANSTGCAPGEYTAGQSITLTASPTGGSLIGGWTGTTNNASTSSTNTVKMPASNHSASVIYTAP